MYLRALFNTFPEWITNYTPCSTSLGLLNELIINTLMYKCARPSATALSLKIHKTRYPFRKKK
jgi:hypothetical protein